MLIVSAPASAAVTFEDVNPNQSNCCFDGTDPDGASGGRVNGVASDPSNPQTFYAASEWGGLYKSTDEGRNWFRLDRHLPVATWRVKVDPSNSNIVYATSFYDGRAMNPISGIQVSRDAGATWTHLLTAHPAPALEGTANDNTPDPAFNCSNDRRTEPSAFGIGIRPVAANNVFIGTNCGVAISNDSGVTWRFVDPTPLTPASNVWDVVVQAGGANGIVDICGDDGHLRSVDGGNMWTASAGLPRGRCSIAVSPDESYVLFVAASDNRVYENHDAGRPAPAMTWNDLGNPETRPNPTNQGRIPFVATNNRAGRAFDLWWGNISLYRGGCETPAAPAPGGMNRCPTSTTPGGWAGGFTRTRGAHDDVGDLVFDTAVTENACPRIFSSDGGVYRNTVLSSPDCHTPTFAQPTVTPHALWLFGMSGANRPGDTPEDLYMGTQDNGSFGTTDAGATLPTWNNKECCDVADIVADPNRVVYIVGFFPVAPNFRIKIRNPGLTGAGDGLLTAANHPPGTLCSFLYPDCIATFGDRQYVVVTNSGVFFTTDITASTVTWTPLGATSDPAGCAVQASVDPPTGTPVFYVQVGGCDPRSGNQLWRFFGTGAGSWVQVDNNDGLTGGFGIFAVDPRNANRLYASNLPVTGPPQMVFSTDGGAHWTRNTELDGLMTGGGVFKYQTLVGATDFTSFGRYPQPTLLAYDPQDPNIVVAGGADSGVFLSTNGGLNWSLLTDPFDSGNSGVPHLPRPRNAYFNHTSPGRVNIFIGTQGRGVWAIGLDIPAAGLGGKGVGMGHGDGKAGLDIVGTIRLRSARALGSPGATVTITQLLFEAGGAGEFVDGLPLVLEADPRNNEKVATFKTPAGTLPVATVTFGARPRGEFTFRLAVHQATIEPPSQCPASDLTTTLIIDDPLNPAIVVTNEQPWRCFKRGNSFEYLRAP